MTGDALRDAVQEYNQARSAHYFVVLRQDGNEEWVDRPRETSVADEIDMLNRMILANNRLKQAARDKLQGVQT